MYHPFIICESIAEKMKDPNDIEDIVNNACVNHLYLTNKWMKGNFTDGCPGIAFFYSAMHDAFPEKGWDKIADEYIKKALEFLKIEKIDNYSLFDGIAGLSLAVYHASIDKSYYNKLLSNLDEWLIEEINESFINQSYQYQDETTIIPNSFYAFAKGISGAIIYLLKRKDNPYLQELAKNCVNILSNIMLIQKKIDGNNVPAWFLTKKHLPIGNLKEQYPSGGFMSCMPFGLSGCLFALSFALLENVSTPNLYQAVTTIATWIKQKYSYIENQKYWNNIIPVKEKIFPLPKEYDHWKYSWISGWVPVMRTLYIAGKALKDDSIKSFAHNTYISLLFENNMTDSNLCSFFSGIAGFMATSYLMAEETQDHRIFKEVNNLEKLLINTYNPTLPFGFQENINFENNTFNIDSPGFAFGAAGIALSLLVVNNKAKSHIFW
jgi:lantibiotic biosynthesis protein